MGGRMTSEAYGDSELAGVLGLIFIGFPLHPRGKPSFDRAVHLQGVDLPTLFLQGTRDDLAQNDLIADVVGDLESGTLHIVDAADHGFHVLKRSGRTDEEVRDEIADRVQSWCREISRTP